MKDKRARSKFKKVVSEQFPVKHKRGEGLKYPSIYSSK